MVKILVDETEVFNTWNSEGWPAPFSSHISFRLQCLKVIDRILCNTVTAALRSVAPLSDYHVEAALVLTATFLNLRPANIHHCCFSRSWSKHFLTTHWMWSFLQFKRTLRKLGRECMIINPLTSTARIVAISENQKFLYFRSNRLRSIWVQILKLSFFPPIGSKCIWD